MRLERRCLWCGRPSSKENKALCELHLPIVRAIERKSRAKLVARRREKGLCVHCGKTRARYGYDTCWACSSQNTLRLREKQDKVNARKMDKLVDRGLITVDEVAGILEVHRSVVGRLLRSGTLKRADKAIGRVWIREEEVWKYKRLKSLLLSVVRHCLKCGYEWSPRKSNSELRCPVRGCKSVRVIEIGKAGILN